MSVAPATMQSGRTPLGTALIITRRELRDSLRDWRIVVPILLLTLIFPPLMNFTARVGANFVIRYGGEPIITERFVPFLLMIVGFFPISFSLVIALETFVGEKERNSIEPLLAMPVTDSELYLGKVLSAMALPLLGSYLGIGVYLIGLHLKLDFFPPLSLLVQILILTTVQAVVMVSGAVVVSSQTTSVRAANLLASFIIIPMALLVQAESVIMFWGRYEVLWVIAAGLVVVDMILVRMGVRIFNREEILGREIDELNLRSIWRTFRAFFERPPEAVTAFHWDGHPRLTIGRIYGHDIPWLLRRHWLPLAVVTVALIGAVIVGWGYAPRYPLPARSFELQDLTGKAFERTSSIGFLPALTTHAIFVNNVRALVLAGILAVFSCGVMAVVLLMAPLGIIGFLAGEAMIVGYNPWVFLATFVLPHAIIELPAGIVATAFALRMGASLISPPTGLTVSEGLLLSLADFIKVFVFLVLPLLLLAAFVEANFTPQVVLWVYGR